MLNCFSHENSSFFSLAFFKTALVEVTQSALGRVWESSGQWPEFTEPVSFPGSSDSKEFVCNSGDPGSIPGLGRFPGGRHGNLLQYPCLENPMDRGAWWAAVHGVPKSGHIER